MALTHGNAVVLLVLFPSSCLGMSLLLMYGLLSVWQLFIQPLVQLRAE